MTNSSNVGGQQVPAQMIAVDPDETSRRLLTASTAPDVLAAVIDQVADTAHFCLVMQLGRVPGADVQVMAEWGVEKQKVTAPDRRIPYALLAPFLESGAAAGDQMLLPHTTVMTDPARDPRVTPPLAHLLARMKVGSFVAVPVIFRGQPHTALIVGRRQPAEYEPALVRHYESIAMQVGGALRNIVLLQQSQARAAQLEVVAEISSAASSILDLDDLLPLAAELIRERFHLYYVGIFLLDDDGAVATLRAGTGSAGQQMVAAGHHLLVSGESMIGLCLTSRQPRIALDVGREAVHFDNPLLPDTRSELALPLMTRDRLVGAMTIQSTHQAAFDHGDVTVFQVMADQLGNAIETARVFQDRERRMTQMAIVSEIGRALSTETDLNALFALVHKQVDRLLDANSFYIAMYEEGRDYWELAFDMEEGELLPGARHSVAAGMTGWMLRHRTSLMFRSAAESAAFHEHEGIPILGNLSRSWMGVPLLTSKKLVGVMGIQDYRREYVYDDSDRVLFETVAAQVAGAVDNARLLAETRQRADEMAVINEVGRAVTSVLDVDEVLLRLVDITKERFGYYCVTIALVTEQGLRLNQSSTIGATDRRLHLPDLVVDLQAPQSLIAECARTAQPVVVGDVLADSRYLFLADVPDTRSELTVPILSKGQVIGTLDVQSDQLFAFDETDVAVLQLLASQAGTAIQNAQLFAETEQRADELAVLHTVSLELAQEQQDLNTVMRTITERTMELLDSDGGGVWLWQADDQSLELVITYQVGDVDWSGRRLKSGEGLTGQAFALGQIQVVDDYTTWQGRSDVFADAPFYSAIALPMTWQTQTVGVLVATRSQAGRPYTPPERGLGEMLAAQAAVALQNARLLEETKTAARQQEMLRHMIETVSGSFDTHSLLEKALAQALDALQLDAGLISLYSEQRGRLTLTAHQGVPEPMAHVLNENGLGGTLCAYVYDTGQILSIDDVRLGAPMPVQMLINNGLVTYAGAPLSAKGERIGTICFFHRTVRTLTADELALIDAIGDQVGLGLTNARLFQETEQRARELAVLNEMGRVLTTQLNVDQVLDNTYHYVSRLLDTDNFYIALDHPETQEVSFPLVVDSGERRKWSSRRSGNGLTEYVIRSAKPLLIKAGVGDFVTSSLGIDLIGQVAESWVGAPLVVGSQVLGVVAVQSYTTNQHYGEHECDLLVAVASQTAVALQNARLFEQIESRARHERALREITTRVRASTHADTIMRTAVRELGAVLDRPAFVRLGQAAPPAGDGRPPYSSSEPAAVPDRPLQAGTPGHSIEGGE